LKFCFAHKKIWFKKMKNRNRKSNGNYLKATAQAPTQRDVEARGGGASAVYACKQRLQIAQAWRDQGASAEAIAMRFAPLLLREHESTKTLNFAHKS
jgi:hypothetical protein